MYIDGTHEIGILGGGSWATAIAKIVSEKKINFHWYMRRIEQIEEFKELRHNPLYLTGVKFDMNKIIFYNDINEIVKNCQILFFAIPSPFFKQHLQKLSLSLDNRWIISAIKGIVPDENLPVYDYLIEYYSIPKECIAVLGGPCHAEEVSLERLSYITIGCTHEGKAKILANILSTKYVKTLISTDIVGIGYASVLKNIYAIASGICYGLKYGDNFQAVLVANAMVEMKRFVKTVSPIKRNMYDSAYLGDLLVTAYSRFSRNHIFGSLIGRGYPVISAQSEMGMVAEGYFGVKCIKEINFRYRVLMPILDAVYAILYEKKSTRSEIKKLSKLFQ